MPWSVVAAVVGAGGAIYASEQSSDAQQSAANSNDALAREQLAEQRRQYDLNREDQERWGMMQIQGEEEFDRRNRADKETAYQRGATLNRANVDRGDAAGNQLSYLMGLGGTGTGEAGWLARRFGASDFQTDPGYQFRMQQGQSGINNQFAQSGSLLSGAAMKALNRFNQDTASSEYNNAYARFDNDQNNQYSRLSGIQAAGQNAINSTNGLGSTVQGSAGNGASNTASNLNSANNQNSQATSSYYNTLMSNNNARANSQSAYNNAFGNQFGSGLGTAVANWNSNNRNNNNYSYPTQNSGGYDYLDF